MAKVVEAKVKADDPRAKAKDSMNLLMPVITVDAGKVAVKVAKEKEKHSRVTKERKEKEAYILLTPCLPQRQLLRLQQHLPKKKTLHKPSKVHQKAQVAAVNVVLGGTLSRVVPPEEEEPHKNHLCWISWHAFTLSYHRSKGK